MIRDGLKPILQVASDWRESFTTGGIPCGAITGLTAHMQNRFVRTKYCMPAVASRIKDIESKYYVGAAVLDLSRPGHDHRGQSQHDPGDGPAGRPREGGPDPRPGRRHHRRPLGDPRRDPPAVASEDPPPPQTGRAVAGTDRQRDRPAPPQGLLAQPPVPVELDGRDDEGLSAWLSRVLRRDAGPRRRFDRLRGADDHSRSRTARPPVFSTSATTISSSSPKIRRTAQSPRPSRRPT